MRYATKTGTKNGRREKKGKDDDAEVRNGFPAMTGHMPPTVKPSMSLERVRKTELVPPPNDESQCGDDDHVSKR
jgi:hypothetical protein